MTNRKQDKSFDETAAAEAEPTTAREYHTPVFTHHGNAANIVRNNEGFGTDGGTGFASDTLS